MGYELTNQVTLVVWTNLTVSLDGSPTANTLMLKVLDQIYVVSPVPPATLSACPARCEDRQHERPPAAVAPSVGPRHPDITFRTRTLAARSRCHSAGGEGVGAKSGSRAWTWAALMHRAFGIDVLSCPHCGGRLRLIATLHDPVVIRKLLAHLGMARSGPSPGPAPPESGGVAP